jgi:hypothetical protein
MAYRCRYCRDSGYISVEPGSSLAYPCTDCEELEEEEQEQEQEEQQHIQ